MWEEISKIENASAALAASGYLRLWHPFPHKNITTPKTN